MWRMKLLLGRRLLLGLTRVKENFWAWLKWVPLVGAGPLKLCSTSDRSEVEAPSDGGSTAQRSCSSRRRWRRVCFLLRYSCNTDRSLHRRRHGDEGCGLPQAAEEACPT